MFDKLSGGISSLKSAAGGIANLAGGSSGKNEKASIFVKKEEGFTQVKVQFNPSEYVITRGLNLSDQKGVGTQSDGASQQTINGKDSTLKLSLYFDSLSDVSGLSLSSLIAAGRSVKDAASGGAMAALTAAASSAGTILRPNSQVNAVCNKFLSLIRFDPGQHGPPPVVFVWGQYLAFSGVIQNSSVQYTMFMPDGTPIRARVDLTILGEDLDMAQDAKQNPNMSPDRTKNRLLPYGDQLWMLANEEYGDPSRWKVIAQENDILNPRKLDRAVRLKVPAIR